MGFAGTFDLTREFGQREARALPDAARISFRQALPASSCRGSAPTSTSFNPASHYDVTAGPPAFAGIGITAAPPQSPHSTPARPPPARPDAPTPRPPPPGNPPPPAPAAHNSPP